MYTNIFIAMFWMSLYDEVVFLTPPPEAKHLISKLGSYDFFERESAHDRLVLLGRFALKPLYQALHNHDPEVQMRAQKIIDEFFLINTISGNELPALWFLPDEYTLNKVHYTWDRQFKKAYIRTFIPEQQAWDYEVNQYAQQEATKRLCQNLLLQGVRKKDILKLIAKMEKIRKQNHLPSVRYAWSTNDDDSEEGSP